MFCYVTSSPQISGVNGTYFFLSNAGLLHVFTQEPSERGSMSTQLPQSQEKKCNSLFLHRDHVPLLLTLSSSVNTATPNLKEDGRGILHVPRGGDPECLPGRVRDGFSGFLRVLNSHKC